MPFLSNFKVHDGQKQIVYKGWPIADIVSALSFLVVLMALYASLKAAKETARANMLNSLPLLTLSYDYNGDKVLIENSGNGTAVNVEVDKFYNWWADPQFDLFGLTTVEFKKFTILKHGATEPLESKVKGLEDPMGLTRYTMFSTNQKPLTFAIKFSDLGGKRYITKIRIDKGKVDIISSPRSYNLISKVKLVVMRLQERVTMGKYSILVSYKKYKHKKSKSKKQLKK